MHATLTRKKKKRKAQLSRTRELHFLASGLTQHKRCMVSNRACLLPWQLGKKLHVHRLLREHWRDTGQQRRLLGLGQEKGRLQRHLGRHVVVTDAAAILLLIDFWLLWRHADGGESGANPTRRRLREHTCHLHCGLEEALDAR